MRLLEKTDGMTKFVLICPLLNMYIQRKNVKRQPYCMITGAIFEKIARKFMIRHVMQDGWMKYVNI